MHVPVTPAPPVCPLPRPTGEWRTSGEACVARHGPRFVPCLRSPAAPSKRSAGSVDLHGRSTRAPAYQSRELPELGEPAPDIDRLRRGHRTPAAPPAPYCPYPELGWWVVAPQRLATQARHHPDRAARPRKYGRRWSTTALAKRCPEDRVGCPRLEPRAVPRPARG